MDPAIACLALRSGRIMRLHYHGFERQVEVHAVGRVAGRDSMLCWQVEGGSAQGQGRGWKNMLLAEVQVPAVTDKPSRAPRPGYNGGGRAMTEVYAEL